MTEKTALVTGASSGIGREIALKLVENDFQVIAVARRMERLNELASRVRGIIPKKVDLSAPDDVEGFCRSLVDLPEPVSVLINNAGYSIRGALEDISLKDARRLFEVNLFSLIRVTQACLPGMRAQRNGIVINMSSMAGKFAFPMSGIYAATKYAVEGISDALRLEVRPLGIRVVTIRPGFIATEFNEVANNLSGDLLARTDPDYKPVYQACGAEIGKMFVNATIPGPEIIANVVMEAVNSNTPKPVYSGGLMSEEFLGRRAELDDEAFDRFLTEKTGLSNLKV
jgi:short-subunit dehydrogenase